MTAHLDVAIATTSLVEDPDLPALVAALGALGVHAQGVAWDDPRFDFDAASLTVVRSTWDYAARPGPFLDWARGVGRLCNPADVVAWNADKRYLAELERAGVPVIPTTYASEGATTPLPGGDVVVKPVVGAGSRGAARFGAAEHDRARRHVDELAARVGLALVQPYVAEAEDGEVDVVVIDGEVSHAVRKHAPMGVDPDAAPAGPLRVEPVVPSGAVLDVVAAVLGALPVAAPLCYARVDVLETAAGPLVGEVELIEPFLFLGAHPAAASRLAGAIVARMGRPDRPGV